MTHVRQEPAIEEIDQLPLLGFEVTLPVVIDVDREADAAVEQSVAKPANEAEAHADRQRGHQVGHPPLDLLGSGCSFGHGAKACRARVTQ